MWRSFFDLMPPRSSGAPASESFRSASSSRRSVDRTELFTYAGTVRLVDGRFTLDLPANTLLSLTTVADAHRPPLPPHDVPPSSPFPDHWADDFQCAQSH